MSWDTGEVKSVVNILKDKSSYNDFVTFNQKYIDEWEEINNKVFDFKVYTDNLRTFTHEIRDNLVNKAKYTFPHLLGHLFIVAFKKNKGSTLVQKERFEKKPFTLNYHSDGYSFRAYLRGFTDKHFLVTFIQRFKLYPPVSSGIVENIMKGDYARYPKVVDNKQVQIMGKKKNVYQKNIK